MRSRLRWVPRTVVSMEMPLLIGDKRMIGSFGDKCEAHVGHLPYERLRLRWARRAGVFNLWIAICLRASIAAPGCLLLDARSLSGGFSVEGL